MNRATLAALDLPFRMGATSYVIPGDLLENAAYLATRVEDMQLVLFDVPDGPCNVPGPDAVNELAKIGRRHDLSYTVHLIHDLVADDASHCSLHSARDVITRTRGLAPHAYVLHLEGKAVRNLPPSSERFVQWQRAQAQILRAVGSWAGNSARLAVENLEGYRPDFVAHAAAAAGACRCIDVGHLWLDGHDPLPYLATHLPHARVIHLHGVRQGPDGRQDHCSLTHTPSAQLDAVIDILLRCGFGGIVTLEVFEQPDFDSSLEAIVASVKRIRRS